MKDIINSLVGDMVAYWAMEEGRDGVEGNNLHANINKRISEAPDLALVALVNAIYREHSAIWIEWEPVIQRVAFHRWKSALFARVTSEECQAYAEAIK